MTNRVFENSSEFALSTTGQTLTNNNSFRNRWSDNVINALLQIGIFEGKVATPSATPPGDTSLIWFDTSAQTEEGQEPAVIRRFDSGTSTWVPVTFDTFFGTATGATNITVTEQAGGVNIDSSSGTGDTIALVTGANAGAMSPTDKLKLDTIQSAAEVNVQADWNETNAGSDAFIRNKPDVTADLSVTRTSATFTIVSDTGTDAVVAAADASNAGAMTAANFTKLGGIETGAEVNVQANWNELDTGSDAFIQNKPTVPNVQAFQDEGVDVGNNPSLINYIGAGVGVSEASGVITVNIPGAAPLSFPILDEGANVTTTPISLNFAGAGVAATHVGDAVTVTVPGSADLQVLEEGVSLASATESINFVGAGATASAIGNDVTVTIPAVTSVQIFEEGVSLTTAVESINFVGGGFTATATVNAVTLTMDAALNSIAGLTTAANQAIYTTAADTYATTSLTAFGRSLIDDADAAAGRTTLGVVPGTDVQAFDAGLNSIAGLTTAANQMIYTTALDTYATTGLTAFGRSLIDDADAAAARSTLGLGSLATASTINNGDWSGADLTVANGGTGRSTSTAYAVLCGGTTDTGAQQSVASLGTANQVLTSNGAGALPTFQDAGGASPIQAWVNFNGSGVVSIRQSDNVSSITDNGIGQYTVNFTSAMTDADYVVLAMGEVGTENGDGGQGFMISSSTAPLTTAVRIVFKQGNEVGFRDTDIACVAIIR